MSSPWRLAIVSLFGALLFALSTPSHVEALGGCTPIGFGQTLTGAISAPGEQDCFSFSGSTGDRIRARVIATTAGWTPFQELLRPDDTVLCSLTGPVNDCTLDATGSHAVRVSAAGGTATGSYSIHVQRLNDPVGCVPIAVLQTLTGSISVPAEEDCFTFTGIAHGRVRVRVLQSTPWIPFQELVRPDGTVKCASATFDDDCSLSVTGRHTILVSAAVAVGGGTLTGDYTITLSCLVAPCGSQAYDVNGDGNADIVWRNTGGPTWVWLLDAGTVIGSGSPGGAGTDWTIEGVADVDGDGKSDIVWRHTSGVVCIWFLDGLTVTGTACPGGAGTDWTIQGLGDFNGDNRADILWRHTSGTLWIWLLDGGTIVSSGPLGDAPTDWTVERVADVNGDGMSDIVWRHTSGVVCIWFLGGLTRSGIACPGGAGPEWTIQRVGDFNGDGTADILWRDTSGGLWIWFLGASLVQPFGIINSGSPGGAPTDWTVAGVADFNRDGKADILWRHTSGVVCIWFLNGLSVTGVTFPGGAGPDWAIQ